MEGEVLDYTNSSRPYIVPVSQTTFQHESSVTSWTFINIDSYRFQNSFSRPLSRKVVRIRYCYHKRLTDTKVYWPGALSAKLFPLAFVLSIVSTWLSICHTKTSEMGLKLF